MYKEYDYRILDFEAIEDEEGEEDICYFDDEEGESEVLRFIRAMNAE